MQELFHQLGIDWRLLAAQGFNFLIVLTVLTFVVYRPLLRIVEERRKKIEGGLQFAKEADERLANVGNMERDRVAIAETRAADIVKKAEVKAQERSAEILASGEKKAAGKLQEAEQVIEQRKKQELIRLSEEARSLIKAAIVKMIDLDPRQIDEKLVEQASRIIKEETKNTA